MNQDFEDDETGMTRMVNVSDDPIVVRISLGMRSQKIRVHPGKSYLFQSAYCNDVRGAGKQITLLPILTRQSLREDRIPRLVREEQAEDARAHFLARTYGTEEEQLSEVERLKADLATAEARAISIASHAKAKAKPAAPPAESEEKALADMSKPALIKLAKSYNLPHGGTKAELVAAIEVSEESD